MRSDKEDHGVTETGMASTEKVIDRRDFLRVTAAAGAGLMLSPMALGQAGRSTSDDLNIALLGSGAQGQILLDACLKIPGIRFKAICDIWTEFNQKRAANLLKRYDHEPNTYVDYQEMLDRESDLDAVLIATPDFWHSEHTVACLNAGLHVYCEKEMSNRLEGARKMVEAALQAGKLLQIGHQRRSNPRYLHCYRFLKEAKILGRITTINGQWNRSVQPEIGWPQRYAIDTATLEKYGFKSMNQFRNWRWYRGLGGGPIVDLGSHQIDIFNWFLDAAPKSVMATGTRGYYDEKTHEWHDSVMAIYDYETRDGAVKAFYQTIGTNSCQGYYECFLGDQGTLLISEAAGRDGVYREQTAPDWDRWVQAGYLVPPVEPEVEAQPATGAVLDVRETLAPPEHKLAVEFTDPYHLPHLKNFFDAVRGRASLNCPHDMGYETAVTVLKVNQAIEAGATLDFKPGEFKI